MSEHLDLYLAFMEQYQAGDGEAACHAYCHPELEIHEPPSLPQGGVFRGQTAPLKVSSIYLGIWNMAIESAEVLDASDAVVLHAVLRWTSKETGRSARVPVLEANWFRDRRIVRMEVCHFDTTLLLDTLPDAARGARAATPNI